MRLPAKFFGIILVLGLLVTTVVPQARADDDLSPVVPSIASFIIPGAGQLINEQPDKALTHFVVIVGIDTASILLANTLSPSYYYYSGFGRTIATIGGALHLAWSGYSAYDAYRVASHGGDGVFDSSLGFDTGVKTERDLEFASPALTISKTSTAGEFSVSKIG